jgi:hypothetical protein
MRHFVTNKNKILSYIQILFLLIEVIIYISGLLFGFYKIGFVAYAVVILQILWMLWSWKVLRGGLFNLYGLTCFVILITHGSIPVILLFGMHPAFTSSTNAMVLSFSSYDIWKGAFLIAIFLGVFHFGALSSKHKNTFLKKINKQVSTSAIEYSGWFFLIIGALGFMEYMISVGAQLKNLNYEIYFYGAQVAGTFAYNLMYFMLVGAFLLIVTGKGKIITLVVSTSSIIIWIIGFAIIGSRNKSVFVLIALIYLFRQIGIKVPLSIIYGGMVAIVLSAWIWGNYRQSGSFLLGNSSVSILYVVNASLSQLGVYFYFVIATVKRFADIFSINYGTSYLNMLSFSIPFGQRFYLNMQPVTWLAQTYFSNILSRFDRYGTGFSFIAEAYESFFWLGAVVMYVLGRMIAFFSNSANNNRLTLFFVSATMLFFLFFPRDVFMGLARGLLWYGFIPILVILIIQRLLVGARHSTIQ